MKHVPFRGRSPARPAAPGRLLPALALALLAGCGTTKFEAQPSFPEPLITPIPVVVGVYIPAEFAASVHEEKRDGMGYSIAVGKAQAAGFQRLLAAMFTRTVPVQAVDAGAATDAEIRGVLEPVLEEFSFITPRDAGTPLYAVSLKYRVNAYTPAGELFESWTFTGYGAQPGSNIPGQGMAALQRATSLAMRDAGAKLVTEFREQAIARGLLPAGPEAEAPVEVQLPP